MAIGGPMWQKSQAAKAQGLGYGQQIKSNFVENRKAQVAALGNKLFSTNINASSGMVELTFQLATSRMQAEFETKKSAINEMLSGSGLGGKIDLLA